MFRTFFKTTGLAKLALIAGLGMTSLGMANQAQAATLDFVVDRANSSVTLSAASGGGLVCTLSRCGVTASLAPSLTTGSTYTIGTGTTSTFEFISFTGNGTTGLSPRSYNISAVLAFSSPLVSVAGSGTNSSFLLLGSIVADTLTWTSVTPQNLTLPDGSKVSFSFGGGTGLFLGNTFSSKASITGIDIVAPVPLPAGGVLLIGALGALAGLQRRKAVIRVA